MADHGKHIDDLFREGLGDYREAPASDIWSKLEQRLPAPEAEAPAPPPVATQSSGNNRWLWYLLLLALLGTVGYFVVRKSMDSSSTGGTNQNIENHGSGQVAGGPAVTPADVTDNTNNDPAMGDVGANDPSATSNVPATANNNSGSGVTANDNAADAPSSSSSNNTPAASGTSGNAGNDLASNSGSRPSKNNVSAKKSGGRKTNQASVQDAADVNDPVTQPGNNAITSNTAKGNSKKNNNTAGTGTKTSRSSTGTATPENSTVAASNTGKKNTTAKPAAETDKPLKPATAATGKPAKLNDNPVTERNKPFKPDQAATFDDPVVKPALPAKEKSEPIADQVVTMGSKNRAQKPVTAAVEPEAKKTWEKTKDGVKMLDVPEDDPKNAVVQDEDEHEAEVEDPVAAKITEEEEEQPQPAVQTGSGIVSSGGGGGGGATKEPHVPLRNFAGGGKLSGGLKAGFEKGMGSINTNAAVFSPYLQWAITPKVALVLQPSFRYNSMSLNMFNDPQAYHNITNAFRDTAFTYAQDTFQGLLVQRTYTFYNTYDSIVMVQSVDKSSYWEVDLPLMAKFNVGGGLSLTGGIVLTFGNIPRVSYSQTKFTGLQRTAVDSFGFVPASTPEPVLPPPSQYFTYNTPNISQAPALNAQNPSGNPARFGYMVGFNYDINNKFMIDVMLRGNLSDMRYIPNEQIRKVYTQPNIRVMFGVKLFESGQNPRKDPSGL